MGKMSNFFNVYGKYLYAISLSLNPVSKRDVEFMVKMFKEDTNV